MILIAHRGASARAPENTIAAFEAAIEDGADAIETDVRLTADGVPVLSHDDQTRTGRISITNRSELASGVPSLEALLATAGSLPLYLELKPWAHDGAFRSADVVARAIAPMLAGVSSLTISSFDPTAVAVARDVVPHAATALGVLDGSDPSWAIDVAATAGHRELHLPNSVVDAAMVARVHAAGLGVAVYTVNDGSRVVELAGIAADAIFTDDPRAARTALEGK